jgi:hypothetical protein
MKKCSYCGDRITRFRHPEAIKNGDKWYCNVNHAYLAKLRREQKQRERQKQEQARRNQKDLSNWLKDWD